MTTDLVLFTADLRVHDQPALHAAAQGADQLVPLFVFDDAILQGPFAAPNRAQWLLDCLADLSASLDERGATLVTRRGDPVDEAVKLARRTDAQIIHITAGVSRFGLARQARLERAAAEHDIEVEVHRPNLVAAPGATLPTGGDHYKVFTPYHRAWEQLRRPAVLRAPSALPPLPDGVDPRALPRRHTLVPGDTSPNMIPGGETEARKALNAWVRNGLAEYGDRHDDLPGDATSHIGAALHFGALSVLEIADKLQGRQGAAAFLRQLCWRDFYHQVSVAFGRITTHDYRPRGDTWRSLEDERVAEQFDAWKHGRTGVPIVDAGMRQLLDEGWMHNRTRMITASYLVKDLYIDWRHGARWFADWLIDGDVANNWGNWQWAAGTGNDTRPNRVFNPLRQAERFDPDGTYVKRYVPELRAVDATSVHTPPVGTLDGPDYPSPLVDHAEATARFFAAREAARAQT